VNLKHNLKNNADHWDITAPTTGGAHDGMLNLTAADFNGALTAENIISINDNNYDAKTGDLPQEIVARNDQKQALLDLETLLNTTLPTNYPSGKGFTKGAELPLTDTTANIAELAKYKFDYDPGTGAGTKDNDNPCHTVYDDFKDNGSNNVYKTNVDD